jgi:hypothetical protein
VSDVNVSANAMAGFNFVIGISIIRLKVSQTYSMRGLALRSCTEIELKSSTVGLKMLNSMDIQILNRSAFLTKMVFFILSQVSGVMPKNYTRK